MHEVSLKRDDRGGLGFELTAHPSHAPASQGHPQQGIFIGQLEPSGPAMKSGRLRPDDELVSVNEKPLEGLSLEEAESVLASAGLSGQSAVLRLRRWEEPSGRLTIRLSRSSRQGMLGFSIVGGRGTPQGDHPIYVRTVSDDSAARNLLFKGDRIDFVNGRSLEGVTHEEAVAILKSVVSDMTLVVHRPGTALSAAAAVAEAE